MSFNHFLLILTAVCLAMIVTNSPAADVPKFPADIRVEQNVSYLEKGRSEKADLYFPAQIPAGAKLPAVLIIHGGGWVGGVRNGDREIVTGTMLAEHGYIGMSIEYLLSKKGEPVWPTNLYDCKNAVRYLRANADRLQIDPDHIGVIGGSAGGHLACMVALTGPDDKLEPEQPYPNISDKVNCCVDMYGVTDVGAHSPDAKWLGKSLADDPQLYKLASPLTYVRPTSPPFLIIHGTADTTVAPNQSQMLEDALKKAGVSEKLIWVKGAHHAFTLNPPQEDLRPMVLAFFDARLKPGRH